MALLTGLLVGYVLAIPPGPIGMAAIRLGLRGRMAEVSQLAVGAGLLDLIYCLLAMWTSAGILDLVLPQGASANHSGVMTAIQMCIAVAMVVAGVVMVVNSKRHDIDEAAAVAPDLPDAVSRWRVLAPFITGVAFAVTNLANPTFIPSLMIMSGSIRSAGLVGYSVPDVVQFSFGFGTGNALWLLTLGGIIRRFRHRLSERLLAGIRAVTAALLIGAGLYYGVSLGLRIFGSA